MELETILTDAILASIIIELFKWIYRYVTKDYTFEFPVKFYLVALPVTTFAVSPILAWLGVIGYVMPSDWETWAKELITVLLASVGAIISNELAVGKLSDYAKRRLVLPG